MNRVRCAPTTRGSRFQCSGPDIAFVALRQFPVCEGPPARPGRVATPDVGEDQRALRCQQRLPDAPHAQGDPTVRQVVEHPAGNRQVEGAEREQFPQNARNGGVEIRAAAGERAEGMKRRVEFRSRNRTGRNRWRSAAHSRSIGCRGTHRSQSTRCGRARWFGGRPPRSLRPGTPPCSGAVV